MVDNIVLPGEIIYYLVVPIALASIPGILMYIKRQELTGQKSTISEYNINTMRNDLTEVKGDVKEARKEVQELKDNINVITIMKEKIERVEERLDVHMPRFEDALRQLGLLDLRVKQIERERRTDNKGAV